MGKGKKNLLVSGLVIQVSPRCTRSRTSGNLSHQEAVKSNLKSSLTNGSNYWRSRDRFKAYF